MAKYDPLVHRLMESPSVVDMTFGEIADLVGELPASASRHSAWWGNEHTQVQSAAWLSAGYRVQLVNLASGRVRFVKDSLERAPESSLAPSPEDRAVRATQRPTPYAAAVTPPGGYSGAGYLPRGVLVPKMAVRAEPFRVPPFPVHVDEDQPDHRVSPVLQAVIGYDPAQPESL